MGNQHNGCSHFFPELTHQLQDLCLDGYVQGCGRLICNKKSWLAGYCHGDHHSLAHTARKLMRIFLHPLLRSSDPNSFQNVHSSCPGFFFTAVLVEHNWFHQLGSNSQSRIQGSHWILKNHGNIISADPAHLFLRKPYQFFSIQFDAAAGNPGVASKKLKDRHGCDTFSASGLAYNSEDPAFFYRKAYTVNGCVNAFFCLKLYL